MVGQLVFTSRTGEAQLTSADRRVLEDLARHAGVDCPCGSSHRRPAPLPLTGTALLVETLLPDVVLMDIHIL